MSNGCSYDCSRHPDQLLPNSDVTGIGVILGYTVTAGFVILLITTYYVTSYDATQDPFSVKDNPSESFHANPIDLLLADGFSRLPFLKPRKAQVHPNRSRKEKAYIKTLTGLSILISGYVQLRCGLSAYHWQLLLYLAYFSSLTHLSCLTFLRRHLYLHQGQRAWRLVAMGAIVIMLCVGFLSTSTYDWQSNDDENSPLTTDYAICYLKPGSHGWPLAITILSVVLVLFGFASRVVKLHRTLSVDIFDSIRKMISSYLRQQLLKVYSWSGSDDSKIGTRRLLLYRPMLALFLMLRVSLDIWTSMFLEVWWLIIAFTWGMERYLATLVLQPVDWGSDAWSFGQVIPVVLLSAPLLAVAEFLLEEDEEATGKGMPASTTQSPHSATAVGRRESSDIQSPASDHPTQHETSPTVSITVSTTVSTGDSGSVNGKPPPLREPQQINQQSRIETLQLAAEATSAPPGGAFDNPDYDFRSKSSNYSMFSVFVCCEVVVGTTFLMVVIHADSVYLLTNLLPHSGLEFLNWAPITHAITCVLYILTWLALEDLQGVVWTRGRPSKEVVQKFCRFWMWITFSTLLFTTVLGGYFVSMWLALLLLPVIPMSLRRLSARL